MTRRERIIVVAMVLAVAYGGYQFLAPKAKRPGRAAVSGDEKGLTPFAAEVVGQMKKIDSTATDTYVVARGNSEWPDNPFFQGKIQTQEAKTIEEDEPAETVRDRLTFSGFLQVGDKTLAIINGTEYESGEALMEYGYFIKSITPGQVTVSQTDGPDTITLTLDDMDE